MVETISPVTPRSESKITYDGSNNISLLDPFSLKWVAFEASHKTEVPILDPQHFHLIAKQRKLLRIFYQSPCVVFTIAQLSDELGDVYGSSSKESIWNSISRVKNISSDFGFRIYSSQRSKALDKIYIPIPEEIIETGKVIRIPFPGLKKTKLKIISEFEFDLEPLLSWYLYDREQKHLDSPMLPRSTEILVKILTSRDMECNIERLIHGDGEKPSHKPEDNLYTYVSRLNRSLKEFRAPFSVLNDKQHTYFIA